MKIDRAGFPFIAATVVPAALLVAMRRYALAAPLAALGGFLAFFFRDPERQVPQDLGAGRLARRRTRDDRRPERRPMGAARILETDYDFPVPDGRAHQPHTGRRPCHPRGLSTRKFLPAYKESSNENELNEVWIDHDGRSVVFRQVVGILARRIVCRVEEGQVLERGQRIGLMKFGSRMDVFLPTDAALLVAVGDQVVGGETVLATLGS